eukprot:GHVU01169390.1.p6 GENE.GHVU01169390.1~~GHVU01169390.1.p6  ORF type:complete len:101 (-),score=11.33 GHVU01169390.1:1355-1657(-)
MQHNRQSSAAEARNGYVLCLLEAALAVDDAEEMSAVPYYPPDSDTAKRSGRNNDTASVFTRRTNAKRAAQVFSAATDDSRAGRRIPQPQLSCDRPTATLE